MLTMIQQDSSLKEHNSRLDDNFIVHRGKGKHNADYGMKHIYRYFIKTTHRNIPYMQFSRICERYNIEFVMNSTILLGFDFDMPSGLGSLGIRKYKCTPYFMQDGTLRLNHLPVDYKATKEFWKNNAEARKEKKLIRHTNDHSDGYKGKFYWDKRTCNVRNQSVYIFLAIRLHSRKINEVLRDTASGIDFCIIN